MHALVTGGGGFLGKAIVSQLVARGDRVRVLCRGDYPALRAQGVDIVRGDVRTAEAVHAACQGVDIVFHAAAVTGIWGPARHFFDINTLGTQHVIEGCRRANVGKLVYTSSPSVVFDGTDHRGADESLPYPSRYLCHYPHSKAVAEQVVLRANGEGGLATCALRPHLIWGAGDTHLVPRLFHRARSGRLRQIGDGSNTLSMVHVENAAHAHLQAADRLTTGSAVAGRVYFVNEAQAVPLWEWINTLLGRGGLPPVTRRISRTAAYAIGAACEAAYSLLRCTSEPPMTRFLALQLGCSHDYSSAAAERDFGFSRVITIEEGLRQFEPDLRRWGAAPLADLARY